MCFWVHGFVCSVPVSGFLMLCLHVGNFEGFFFFFGRLVTGFFFSVLFVWLVFSNFVVVWFLGFWCFVCLVGFLIILLCFGDWALNFVWF